jgi:hypothetical protein
MDGPRGAIPGAVMSARRPVSRILSCAVIPLGAASPRTLISDLPGGFGNGSSRLSTPGRHGARTWLLARALPPYLVLLRVGFTLPPALQPERCALTAPFHPYPGGSGHPGEPEGPSGGPSEKGVAEAVSFLWHWPSMSLYAQVPDVIRHTALRSSDFPPPGAPRLRVACPAATARSPCQCLVYRE